MKKLDQQKLEELHAFLEADKNAGRKEMEDYLGEDPTPWIVGLKERYPEKYVTDDEEPAPKAKKQAKVKESTEVEYFLVKDGIKQPLNVKATKNNQVILETIEPTDKVVVIIKGEEVTIDLLKLEQESARLGVPVGQLQILGDMAKL